ncbi:DUF2878 domain-containing protein [Ferrimonas balearica]|uniref:DUF2878 domain-containing protein n=1 Tax=Ferrimonas balearica TaxID=44012 RepID=UPI001F3B0FFF|nr:DUF2878 domain-containing protein [Ferrimonas balearica]MBY6019810.1 DUF2878 domain-containing protein [Halomonas denitrificans]MBY6096877.1 DUF2878 domain-containing protein [Ferrimonas balearica]
MNRRLIAVLVLFDINWALAVFGQQDTLLWQALTTLAMVACARGWRLGGLAIAAIGMAFDGLLIQQQVLSLTGSPVAMPIHLALLWVGFGLTLAACHQRLPRSPWALALVGGIIGALGYFLGVQFGALQLAPTTALGVIIIGVGWAALFPLCRALFTTVSPIAHGR